MVPSGPAAMFWGLPSLESGEVKWNEWLAAAGVTAVASAMAAPSAMSRRRCVATRELPAVVRDPAWVGAVASLHRQRRGGAQEADRGSLEGLPTRDRPGAAVPAGRFDTVAR